MEERTLYGINVGRMALVCLYRNLGLVALSFPTSGSASPSSEVVATLTGREVLWPGDTAKFPCSIRWDLWQWVCVPVLEDGAVAVKVTTGSLRNAGNVDLLSERPPTVLLEKIEVALIARFEELGLFPSSGDASTSSTTDGGAADGEPIVRGTSDPLGDDLRWPEGHLRLTYPTVD